MPLRVVAIVTVVVTLFLLMYSISEHSASGIRSQLEDCDREMLELQRRIEESQSCEETLTKALEDAVLYKEMAENCVHQKIKVRSK